MAKANALLLQVAAAIARSNRTATIAAARIAVSRTDADRKPLELAFWHRIIDHEWLAWRNGATQPERDVPASRLGRQLAEVTSALRAQGVPFALIGGLALASYNVVRATQDIDLLIDLELAEHVEQELLRLGYRCLHRSSNAANYVRGSERLDFLYASRPIAVRLLQDARELPTSLGVIRVISVEGLIGFKLQGWVNDSRRTQDLEDIRALLRANRGAVRLDEVRHYFQLFDKEALLDELIDQTG